MRPRTFPGAMGLRKDEYVAPDTGPPPPRWSAGRENAVNTVLHVSGSDSESGLDAPSLPASLGAGTSSRRKRQSEILAALGLSSSGDEGTSGGGEERGAGTEGIRGGMREGTDPFAGDVDFIALPSSDEDSAIVGADGGRGLAREEGGGAEDAGLGMPPWEEGRARRLASLRSPFLRLHQEILDFRDFLSPTPEEATARNAAVERVRRLVAQTFREGTRVELFGSFATGLCLPTSDVDAVVLGSGVETPQAGLNRLANALRREGMARSLEVIGKARVPIVKFIEKESGYAFDISFDMPNGPRAARFIRANLRRMPALGPIVMVVKQFLSQRELNEVYTGGLGSYALILMCISHLQHHQSRRSVSETNRNAAGDARRGKASIAGNLGELLLDFFETFGKRFNYFAVGMAVRDGGSYYNKEDEGMVDERRPGMMSIQDPMDAENDVSKNSYGIMRVRSAFEYAYHVLRVALQTDPWDGADAKLAPEDNPSLYALMRIMRMDQVLVERSQAPLPEPKAPVRSRVGRPGPRSDDVTTRGAAAVADEDGEVVDLPPLLEAPTGGGTEPQSARAEKRALAKLKRRMHSQTGGGHGYGALAAGAVAPTGALLATPASPAKLQQPPIMMQQQQTPVMMVQHHAPMMMPQPPMMMQQPQSQQHGLLGSAPPASYVQGSGMKRPTGWTVRPDRNSPNAKRSRK